MRFLVDQNLSPLFADQIRLASHDVVHTRDIDLATSSDEAVLEWAVDDNRILISADTDFGFLLVVGGGERPSVILLRLRSPRPAVPLAALLLANLDAVADDLEAGAVVVLEDERVRVRRLPIR